MTDWLVTLNEAWSELGKTPAVTRQYRSRLISSDMLLEIDAGLRAYDDAPCLMLQTSLPADALFELGGMRLSSVPDDRGPLLVLSLEDSSRRDLFSTICADVVCAAERTEKDQALNQFLARLDAWRQFLRDRRDGLSRSETIGLLGELIVLENLLARQSHTLDAWKSPADGLHDFQSGGHALEVKAGLGPAANITISRLDQLDTTGLERLNLLHVRLVEAQGGRSLSDVLMSINDLLPSEQSRRAFENAVLRRGLLPGDEVARRAPMVQLRTIEAYSVKDDFPRLSRATLPVAIIEATYTLEVRAISAFSVDLTEVLDAFLQRDQA